MRYRADIDGLRTLAVVPVVLFHAGVPFVGGGFVGVDVFFVISGFLITRLILLDMARGGFSIADFYARRIRRIFPALAAVLLFCLAAGYAVMAPEDYARLGRSIVSVTLFASNFHFWKSTDYFNPDADAEALLHTWSLAVEEQFYIFYPLLLVLLARRGWRAQPWLTGLLVASLAAAAVMVFVKPAATFYLLPTRAWELLAGGLVALGVGRGRPSPRTAAVAAAAGLALIVVPMLIYSRGTTFPGLTALPPVLGAALLIWAGEHHRTFAARLLAARPMVYVGQLSYSLYLWHVPLLSFMLYLYGGRLTLPVALFTCAAAFAASVASLHLIERPFRRPGATPFARRMTIAGPSAAIVAAAFAGVMIVGSSGWPQRLDPATARLLAATGDKFRHPEHCMSVGARIVPPTEACRMGAPGVRPSAILWGDSHAMVTATAMELQARRMGGAFWFAAAADCPTGLGFAISDATERGLTTTASYRYCRSYNDAMLKRALGDPSIRTVVLSSRWSNWRIGEPGNPVEDPVDLRLVDAGGTAPSTAANRAIFEQGFVALVRRLNAAGKRVFVVGPVPEPSWSVPEALYVQRFGLAEPIGGLSLSDYRRRHAAILTMFGRVQATTPFDLIRPERMLCDGQGRCPLVRDGVPTYFDHNHLSVDAARRTAAAYAPMFAAR